MVRATQNVTPVIRASLAEQVYAELESALLEGRLYPGQRLKIRELALSLQVSETPVREAVVQLARTGAFNMQASRSITVAGLNLEQYLELRTIRIELEGLAAERAAECIDSAGIEMLKATQMRASTALRNRNGVLANKENWVFHRGLCAAARMPELLSIVETIWLRNGPVMALQFPKTDSVWPAWDRHVDIIEALSKADGKAARFALQRDLIEGGRGVIEYLSDQDARGVNGISDRRVQTFVPN